jgi:kynurenine formamidase
MWVDCTQTLAEDSPVLPPLHPAPEFEDFATLEGDGYNSTVLHLETHCGTHMDAPTHFFAPDDHRSIDEVTPPEMVTEGVVFDFSGKEPGTIVPSTHRPTVLYYRLSDLYSPNQFLALDFF